MNRCEQCKQKTTYTHLVMRDGERVALCANCYYEQKG